MMVVPRAALRRATMVVSVRNCSSGKLANSGTALRTAVETVVAIGEMPPLDCKSMLAEARLIIFSAHAFVADPPLPPADSRFRTRRLYRGRLCRARQPQARADRRHSPGRPAYDHHRRGQLAGRRRRRAGPRPHGAFPSARRAL